MLIVLLEGCSSQRKLVHQSFILRGGIDHRVPSIRLVWPDDMGKGAIVAPLDKGKGLSNRAILFVKVVLVIPLL